MIKIKNLYKSYGDNMILKNINEVINDGEVVSIIGPSGSGKSTFLRCLNLIEEPTKGQIYINEKEITNVKKAKEITEMRQNVGMVFQEFNLFPHKTVLENIILAPIFVKKVSEKEAISKAEELLIKVGLIEKKNEYPDNLSGGQKQRIAIARALAMEPEIMLFDEPTSALDPEMVNEVLEVIKELSKTGITMIIVTHEMNFARNISTEIFFMDNGKVIERKNPENLFNNPKEQRTKEFLNKIIIN